MRMTVMLVILNREIVTTLILFLFYLASCFRIGSQFIMMMVRDEIMCQND